MKQLLEDYLRAKGYSHIASIDYGLPSRLYWSPRDRVELQVSIIEPSYLLKGMKKYVIVSMGEEGRETLNRDLAALMDYLDTHFPECRLFLATNRDITLQMVPTMKESLELGQKLACASKDFEQNKKRLEDIEWFLKYANSDTAKQLLGESRARLRSELQQLKDKGISLERAVEESHALIREYLKHGRATSLVFGYSTSLQVCDERTFGEAFEGVVKDVLDAHRFQIKQKLEGSQLQIYIEELQYPWLAYAAEWVGIFSPSDISRLNGFEEIQRQAKSFFMVAAANDIVIGGAKKVDAKRTPAHAFREFLKRAKTSSTGKLNPDEYPIRGGWLGHVLNGDEITEIPFLFPVAKLNHGYVSGTTGAGKSYMARVLVENALIEGINVLILDPTSQWSGLVNAAKDESTLRRFDKLGVSRDYARSFDAKVYTPDGSIGTKLPRNLRELLTGCSFVSFKGTSEEERFTRARDILRAAYASMDQEAEGLKHLIVLEEVHKFLPKKASETDKEHAKEVVELIDSIGREGRKYGLNLLLISQSLSDFRYGERTVREMMNSRFFLRANDPAELEFVEAYISREASEMVKTLKDGEAVVYSSFIPTTKIFVRAPFSHVGELTQEEIRSSNEGIDEGLIGTGSLSEIERKILEAVKNHYNSTSKYLILSEVAQMVGLPRGGRIKKLIDDLETKGYIKTKMIDGRGKPRVVIPPNMQNRHFGILPQP